MSDSSNRDQPEPPLPPHAGNSEARSETAKPEVKFFTAPKLVLTDDGLQVQFDLVNLGPARVGFSFDVNVDGEIFEVIDPTLALSATKGPIAVKLKVPLEADPAASVTVTVKGGSGETLAVGTGGISITPVAAPSVTLGWGLAVVGGLAIATTVGFLVWQPSPPFPTDDTIPTAEPLSDPVDDGEIDAELDRIADDDIAIAVPASLELAQTPTDDDTLYPFGPPTSITLSLNQGDEADPMDFGWPLATEAAEFIVTVTLDDRTSSAGKIVLPLTALSGAQFPARSLITDSDGYDVIVDLDEVPAGLWTSDSCRDKDRNGVPVGPPFAGWPATGDGATLSIAVGVVPSPIGPELAAVVFMETEGRYTTLSGVDPDRPRPDGCDETRTTTTSWGDFEQSPTQQRDPEPGASEPVTSPEPVMGPLREGHSGNRVRALKERLNELGYLDVGDVDSDFTAATTTAVRAFQTDTGIAVDGLVGPQTHSALDLVYPTDDAGNPADNGEPIATEASGAAVMPDLVGQNPADAENEIAELLLALGIEWSYSDPTVCGEFATILDQAPAAGTPIPLDGEFTFSVTRQAECFQIPDVRNTNVADAAALLDSVTNGRLATSWGSELSCPSPFDADAATTLVTSQNPEPGIFSYYVSISCEP